MKYKTMTLAKAIGLWPLVAMALLPTAAYAADIPGGTNTGATLPISAAARTTGQFERDGDSDWYRVYLSSGRDYAFDGTSWIPALDDGAATLRLRGPSGQVIAETRLTSEAGGFEVRAPYTGRFFVEIAEAPGYGPGSYAVRAAPDCRGDAQTECVIRPGTSRDKLLGWGQDKDWLSASLQGGVAYVVTVTPREGFSFEFGVVDAGGKWIAGPADVSAASLTFTPTVQGRYFLVVEGVSDKDNVHYTIALATR